MSHYTDDTILAYLRDALGGRDWMYWEDGRTRAGRLQWAALAKGWLARDTRLSRHGRPRGLVLTSAGLRALAGED